MVGGIENVYHDPCQDWLDLINMKVTSPNYPDAYDPLEYCIWNITAPTGHFVTLDFEKLEVSNNSLGMNCPMFSTCSGFFMFGRFKVWFLTKMRCSKHPSCKHCSDGKYYQQIQTLQGVWGMFRLPKNQQNKIPS